MDVQTPHPFRQLPTFAALPASDARHFRACLGSFATGVTVVTAIAADGRRVGLTVNSFNSLSLEPALVLWSLGLGSRSLEAFQSAKHFAVNILAADQLDTARAFSRSGVDRFEGIETHPGLANVPLLEGALAWFECETRVQHRHGDHVLFIGEVLRCARVPGEGLVFQDGAFRTTCGADDAN